jgi:chromosome segregation ATPase
MFSNLWRVASAVEEEAAEAVGLGETPGAVEVLRETAGPAEPATSPGSTQRQTAQALHAATSELHTRLRQQLDDCNRDLDQRKREYKESLTAQTARHKEQLRRARADDISTIQRLKRDNRILSEGAANDMLVNAEKDDEIRRLQGQIREAEEILDSLKGFVDGWKVGE